MTVSRMFKMLLGLAVSLLLLPAARAATPQQYDAALARVQTALSAQIPRLRAGVASSAGSPVAFLAPRLLHPITRLERPGAPPAPVNTRLMLQDIAAADHVRDLTKRAAVYEALIRQVRALRRDLRAPFPAARPAADPRLAARAVLSLPAFQSDPLPPPSPLDRLVAWIEKQLSKLHGPHLSGGPRISPEFIRAILFLILAGALGVLVYVLVQTLRRQGGRAAPLALDEAEAALVEARDTDSLIALAEQQARAGDFRRAFRLTYLATLVALDTGGVLRFDRSKTNWEYLRALRASGRDDVFQSLSPLTREFDRLWYGFGSATAADYQRALTQYEALKAAPQAAPG